MALKELYEKVSLRLPLEQRRFFNYLNDSVQELLSLYPGFVSGVGTDLPIHAYTSLDEDFEVLPLYHEAVADNILFLAGADEAYKSEFLRKSNDAWLAYWNRYAKGRRIRRGRW